MRTYVCLHRRRNVLIIKQRARTTQGHTFILVKHSNIQTDDEPSSHLDVEAECNRPVTYGHQELTQGQVILQMHHNHVH